MQPRPKALFRVFTATVARVRDCRGRQLRRLCRCHRVGAMTDIGPVAHPLAVQNCESATTAIVLKA